MDEQQLDQVAEGIDSLPEPLAVMAIGVEVARADGDATGIRKRLFELAIGLVRYGVSVGLALLQDRLGEEKVGPSLGKRLSGAARMSDGQWCQLLRSIAAALQEDGCPSAAYFSFAHSKALASLVQARNLFVHGGSSGDDAPSLLLAVLQAAEPLIALEILVVSSEEPASFEPRMGLPLRPGVWRKRREPLAEGAQLGHGYLMREERWLPLTPWLPSSEGRLLLIDAPHRSGGAWRWFDSENHEHRACPELDASVQTLVGIDCARPVQPSQQPRLVGRTDALQIMRQSAAVADAGGTCLIVVTGPQGMGRGRMLEATQEAAAGLGFGCVVEATCSQHRRGLLRPLQRALSESDQLQTVQQALTLARAGDALAGSEGLAAAIEAVEQSLVEASLDEPLLLLLDDAQWADEATLKLLLLLTDRAARKASGRMMVVVAIRDEPNRCAQLTELIGEIEREVGLGATRIALGPLDDQHAHELLQAVAPLAKPLQETLLAGAAGVPFLLVQSALAWFEMGRLTWRQQAWHPLQDDLLREPVAGMKEIVRARLSSFFDPGSRVSETADQVLFCLVAADGIAPLTLLEEVLGGSRADTVQLERCLEALVAGGLLMLRGGQHAYGFAQPMLKQAVAAELNARPWAPRVRRRLLDSLARQDQAAEDGEFLAEGYLKLGDQAEALRWLCRANAHHHKMGLFWRAAETSARLVQLESDPERRAHAQLDEMRALLKAGDAQTAKDRARSGVDSPTPTIEVRKRLVALQLETALGLGEHDETTPGDAQSLVRDADRLANPALAIEARLAGAQAWRGQQGLAWLVEARQLLPEEVSELAYRVAVLHAELLNEQENLETPQARAALDRARKVAERLGSRWASLDAQHDLAVVDSSAGRHDEAIERLKAVVEQATAHHFGKLWRTSLLNLATVMLRADRFADANQAAQKAAVIAEQAGDRRLAAMAHSVRGDALREVGMLDDARIAIDKAINLKRQDGDVNVAIALLRRAEIRLASGDGPGALADATQALDEAQNAGNHDQTARARLWLALHPLSSDPKAAKIALARAVEAISTQADSLRGPTRRLLALAQERLRAAPAS